MTGVILAVARAAGEVAPLMLVGVVKLAPSLPLDGNYPFLHLDQKFMHLGFQLFDAALFARLPPGGLGWVACIALILVLLIGVLNITAVSLRTAILKRKTFENPF